MKQAQKSAQKRAASSLFSARRAIAAAPLRHDRRGLAAVEYALLLAAILIVVASAFSALGGRVASAVNVAGIVVAGGNGSVATTNASGNPGGGGAGGGDSAGVASVFNSSMPACAGGACTAPGNCFVAGTLVATPSGLRAIDDLKEGDLVLSRGAPEEPVVARAVARTFVRAGSGLVDVGLTTVDGEHDVVRSTPEHPYWTLDRGWVSAGDLVIGETIEDVVGHELQVDVVAPIPGEAAVYNVEVGEHHTYFVGHLGAWVHNVCSTGAGGGTPTGGGTSTGGTATGGGTSTGGTSTGGTATGGGGAPAVTGPAPGSSAWANTNWNATGKLSGDGNFNGHWTKHQSEFPGMTATDYANQAESLRARMNAHDPSLQTKTGAGGKTYLYDSATNEFAVVQSSGKISTLFKPGAGQAYYDKQK